MQDHACRIDGGEIRMLNDDEILGTIDDPYGSYSRNVIIEED
jgi:hypothetical protein